MTRAEVRRERKALNKSKEQAAKQRARQNGRRALLRRQSDREKAGFYEGQRPVAQCIARSRSRVNSTKRPLRVSKGKAFGRVILSYVNTVPDWSLVAGRKYEVGYHATKGWRVNRATA